MMCSLPQCLVDRDRVRKTLNVIVFDRVRKINN
jgi:hypothetical protein